MSGFICLHRDVFNHPLLQEPARFKAWFWLVSKAAWKPTPFDINGKVIMLKRGQLSISYRGLAKEWGWSRSSIERFFTRLKTETMIETQSGTGRLIVTICNYSKYQNIQNESGTTNETPIGTRAGHERDTKEQVNQLTKEKTNNKKENSKPVKTDCPDGVDETVWRDFKVLRKSKRAPITETALEGIEKEAVKASLSMNEALSIMVRNGWQGLNANWVKGQSNKMELPIC